MVLNLQAGFVKYYKESVENYNVLLKQAIYNPRPATTYVRITLVNQGNLGFTFDDGTTEKTLSLGANASSNVSETIVPATTPTETMKDNITLKIEFFKNSDYTGKFGEDTVNYQINYYIQNSDGSWTSSQYPNEDDVIYDYWTADQFVVDTDASIPGAKGILQLTHGGSHTKYYQSVPGIVSDTAAELWSYNSGYTTFSGYKSANAYQYLEKKVDGTHPTDAIFAGIVKYNEGDQGKVTVGWTGVGDLVTITSAGRVAKFVMYPTSFQRYIHQYGRTYAGSYSNYSVDVYFTLDGIIAFHPLP